MLTRKRHGKGVNSFGRYCKKDANDDLINFCFVLFFQIGILEAAPSRQEDNGGAYYMRPTRDEPPPYYTQGDGHFADITSMFLANGVKVKLSGV